MSSIFHNHRVLYFDRLDSTNKKAREIIREGHVEEGTIVHTSEQYSGKGYGENTWESEAGKNLTASIILKPLFMKPSDQFRLNKAVSLAVADTVKKHLGQGSKVSIKWPNDIYVDRGKIAGILVENSIMGDKITESICGIGINVNQTQFLSDAPNPVSLKMISGKDHNLRDVLRDLHSAVASWYQKIQTDDRSAIDASYLSLLYLLGQQSMFEAHGIEFRATIRNIGPYGHLVVETEEGEIRNFDFKEIRFLL